MQPDSSPSIQQPSRIRSGPDNFQSNPSNIEGDRFPVYSYQDNPQNPDGYRSQSRRYDSLKQELEISIDDKASSSKSDISLVALQPPIVHPQYRVLTFENPIMYDPGQFPAIFYEYGVARLCKILICITIYNEEETELRDSLTSVAENIDSFVKTGISNEQIAVFLIQDGIEKLSPSMIAYGKKLGLFDFDLLQKHNEPNSLHFFETVRP